ILENSYSPSKELEAKLLKRCKEYLSKWSVPQEFIFRDELPLTQIGKISYVELENEIKEELKIKKSKENKPIFSEDIIDNSYDE
ncbi:MAG: hypothetical protein LBM26_04290, partial [Methanobrevibacter sp.]|nr:hypothetical protein [Methanobrevibacter sp.]